MVFNSNFRKQILNWTLLILIFFLALPTVPIQSVTITDSNGSELVGAAGPFAVGDTPTLACRVLGGDPEPQITWWKNGHLLDEAYHRQESRK